MIDITPLNDLLDFIFNHSKADQTEAVIFSRHRGLTRFNKNSIHQNVQTEDKFLILRTMIGKRVLVAATNRLDRKNLSEFIDTAVYATKLQKEDPDFFSLPVSNQFFDALFYDEKTASLGPYGRAEISKYIFENASYRGILCSGNISSRNDCLCVGNSLGNRAFFRHTVVHLSLTAMKNGHFGWGGAYSRKVDELDVKGVMEKAFHLSESQDKVIEIEPGDFTVILEEQPFASLLNFLSWIAFGAKAYLEGRSYFSGKWGKQVVSENISIFDDYSHPLFPGLPFDFEGMPRKKLALIENGVFSGIAFDSYHSNKAKLPNTGHASIAVNIEGPYPADLVFPAGQYTREEMISSVKRGILVTRLWYIRVVDYKRAILTGMTRDGTFLIEDGQIVGAVKNLRFNQNMISALNNISMIGKDLKVHYEMAVKSIIPMVRIENFKFTGKTLF